MYINICKKATFIKIYLYIMWGNTKLTIIKGKLGS